jgi:hypothetical protein
MARRNGGYVFSSYLDIIRAFAFRAKEPVVHPAWRTGEQAAPVAGGSFHPGRPLRRPADRLQCRRSRESRSRLRSISAATGLIVETASCRSSPRFPCMTGPSAAPRPMPAGPACATRCAPRASTRRNFTRDDDLHALWLSPDLLIGETCSQPLASFFTAVSAMSRPRCTMRPAAGEGTYRSAIVRRKPGADMPAPGTPMRRVIPPRAISGRFAANEPNSMSGYVTLLHMTAWISGSTCRRRRKSCGPGPIANRSAPSPRAGRTTPSSIAYSWWLARQFEPAANAVHVAGWASSRPACR